MKRLKEFQSNAVSRGLCLEYLLSWTKKQDSIKDMLGLSLSSATSSFYFATSIDEGWGFSYDEILSMGKDYINKDVCYIKDNFTHSIYICDNNTSRTITANVSHICHCTNTEYIISDGVLELHITNKSDIKLDISNCIVPPYIYLYNGVNVEIIAKGDLKKANIINYDNIDNTILSYNCDLRIKTRKYELNKGV